MSKNRYFFTKKYFFAVFYRKNVQKVSDISIKGDEKYKLNFSFYSVTILDVCNKI
mgnify:FL=1